MNIWSAVIYYRFGFAAERLWNVLGITTTQTVPAWCPVGKERKNKSGNKLPHSKWLLTLLLLCTAATAQAADKPKLPEAAKTLPWLSSLAEGQRRAAADRKPIFIRVSASWCPPCRKLDAEIEKPSVQAELARWTLVCLDADKAEEEVAELNVSGVPALRIRTMLGESVAAEEGFLTAEDLVSWLKKQYEAAAAEADEVLLSDDEPDAAGVVRLLRQFQQRNPAIREAAIRRLARYPQKARLEVVRAFAEGNLSRRLAALELLQQWRAPVAELDPWQPQSLTKERIAALERWAEKYVAPVEAKKLTEQDLAEARREIDRMLKANESDAAAVRARLAGYGPALLPEITARLKETAADEQRQRLWALRYRLVAADSLALRWPGGLERLADSDPRHRRQAADELARLSAAADQPLLVELFSDSDPLVREFSLRGLQNIGGKETTAALLKLLADPEPNVRAAVLKQFEEKPDASIVPKLDAYLKTEKDADLLVHAIRFLRAAGGAPAVRALIPLLHHESWQVRAEACEALGKTQTNHSVTYMNGERVDSQENLQVEIYAAMLDLLDDADAFVVSRAVEGLSGADMAVAVDPLVRAATKHPDLAPLIVQMLARGQQMRVAALPHLRKFRKDANPQVRAAALAGLCTLLPNEAGDEIDAGLQDPSDKVRIAAAQVCFQTMEAQRSALVQQMQQQRRAGNAYYGGAMTYEVSGSVVAAPQSHSLLEGIFNLFAGGQAKEQPAVVESKVVEGKKELDSPEKMQLGEIEETPPPVLDVDPTLEKPAKPARGAKPNDTSKVQQKPAITSPPSMSLAGPPITSPPITAGPPITSPPIITGPPITSPPVIAGPPITSPPIITGPPIMSLSGPPITSPPVIAGKPAITSPPAVGSKPAEASSAADDEYEVWLKEYYAGKRRPAWAADLIAPLEKMLQAKNVDERLMAGLALAPLGKPQAVLPQLVEVARSDPKKFREVMEVLPWLAREQRMAAFEQFRKIAPTPEAVTYLVRAMVQVRDQRVAELLWPLLADPKATPSQAGAVEMGLLGVYGIDNWYSSRSNGPAMAKNPLLAEMTRSARARAAAGSDMQRLVALALLTYSDPEGAIEIAERLEADQHTSADLRRDALQVLLAVSPRPKGDQLAAAALSGKDAALQKAALHYFVDGPQAFREIREEIYVQLDRDENSIRGNMPIVPKPPEGLKVSQLLPLLDDPDPAVAADAGYLLALAGEARGLEPLLRYAQQKGASDSSLQRLAYRAIAALDESNQIPLLRKIYAGLKQYEVSEFYWTIRIMTGPEILKFRKQIRDEVGMGQLQ